MGIVCTIIEDKAKETYLDHMLEETHYMTTRSNKIVSLERCLDYAKEHNLVKYQYAIEGYLINEKLKPLW